MILNLYNIRVRPALRFVDITIRNLNIIRHNERRPSTIGESELDMNGKHLKLVGLLIIPALLLFAIACGGDTPPDQPAQPEPAAPSQAPAAPSAAGPSAPQSPAQPAVPAPAPTAASSMAPAPTAPSTGRTGPARTTQPAPQPAPPAEKLQIVTTSNIVADWVSAIGQDRVEVFPLLPVNADPHTFQPGARDVARVADADAGVQHRAVIGSRMAG